VAGAGENLFICIFFMNNIFHSTQRITLHWTSSCSATLQQRNQANPNS